MIAIKILASVLVVSTITALLAHRGAKNTMKRLEKLNAVSRFGEWVEARQNLNGLNAIYQISALITVLCAIAGMLIGIWSVF